VGRVDRLAWAGIAIISVTLIGGTALQRFDLQWLEVIGFITGLVSVWLAVKNSPTNWPVGIVECAAYLIVFYEARLFANAFLQFLFIVISLWGWYEWLHGGKNATPRPITPMPIRLALILVVLTAILTYLVTIFVTAIEGSAPFWDTLTTVVSLVATYVMGRRHIENWLIWIGTDVVYILLFFSQQLYLTTILYFIFLVMCLRGYWEWRVEYNKSVGSGGLRDARLGDRQILPVS